MLYKFADALEFEGFPDTITNEEDLTVFLEGLGLGPILECKLARNYYGTLF
jgi:hypothetical protein